MFSTINFLISSIFIATLAQFSTCAAIKGAIPRIKYVGNVGTKQFFSGENDLISWQEANEECGNYGMDMAILNNTAEHEFLVRKMFGENPVLGNAVWFGARDIGRMEMFVWSASPWVPEPQAPAIGDFLNFYFSVEGGPMALTMQIAFGTTLVGVHSHERIARALCQVAGA